MKNKRHKVRIELLIPKKERKLKFIEIYFIVIFVLILFIMKEAHILNFIIILLYLLYKFIAPMILSRYNITLTDEYLILNQIDLIPVKIRWASIKEIKKEERDKAILYTDGNGLNDNYVLNLDDKDIDVLLRYMTDIETKKIQEINSVIDRALE